MTQRITAAQARERYFSCREHSPWLKRYRELWIERADEEAPALAATCTDFDHAQRLYDEAPPASRAEGVFRKLWFMKAEHTVH